MLDQTTETFLGSSPAVEALREEIRLAAGSDSKVIIAGESGVGKEVVARLIHRQSRRAKAPLLVLNCAGVPDSLLESELFGYVRGSFTGAYRDKKGLLELSEGGTIVLDEIGEMSLRMQALMLRFLESGEIQPVGGDRFRRAVEVRVIAATNRGLVERIEQGQFREDLYYRLNVIALVVPPLRERKEDIPELFDHFIAYYAARYQVAIPQASAEALEYLLQYDWPGNVRELRNVAERLVVRSTHRGAITLDDLPSRAARMAKCGTALNGHQTEQHWQAMYNRIVKGGESFWRVAQEPFMARDITRVDIQEIVRRGLEQTRGSYKLLIELFGMPKEDYKRFLSFLRKYDCQVPYHAFRTAHVAASESQITAPMKRRAAAS